MQNRDLIVVSLLSDSRGSAEQIESPLENDQSDNFLNPAILVKKSNTYKIVNSNSNSSTIG